MPMTKIVQTTAASKGSSHPAMSASRQVIGESVRRRLSIIFQRPLAGIAADCVRALPSRRGPSEYPRQQLPVPARPAMIAKRGNVIAGGVGLDGLDIGDQACAGEHALEEVVTEQGGVGRAALECGFKGVDRVDALAGVGSFLKQVLIDVAKWRPNMGRCRSCSENTRW